MLHHLKSYDMYIINIDHVTEEFHHMNNFEMFTKVGRVFLINGMEYGKEQSHSEHQSPIAS